MNEPILCFLCLSENVVAPANGPTCTHKPKHGADWFPSWWSEKNLFTYDERRAEWLKNNERNP
jgi:hypothetical protein